MSNNKIKTNKQNKKIKCFYKTIFNYFKNNYIDILHIKIIYKYLFYKILYNSFQKLFFRTI